MGCIVGVDGGNTKTITLVATADGLIIGAGRSGCSDIYGATSPQAALDELALSVDRALNASGHRRTDIDTACFCLAGADWPEDYTYLQAEIEALGFGRKVTIYNDSLGALRAGTPDGIGVGITCGTGIAIAARSRDGLFWQSGFWVESLGGIELGNQALRAVYRSELGIDPPTSMTEPILRHFQQPNIEALLRRFTLRGIEPPTALDVSKLAPMVLDAAEAGDSAAAHIVQQHAVRLAEYALAAARKVKLDGETFPLVLNGGIFRHPGRRLVDAILSHLVPIYPDISPVRSRYDPAVGALLLALESADVGINDSVVSRVEQSLPTSSLFCT
jgi:N-acetylglucosamine kinase-like BadF-type ATPase